jgi:cytochrome c oxidase subunit 2
MPGIPIHPEQASTIAQGVDHLYFFLTGVTLFFTALIFALIFYFAIRYRRHSDDERPPEITGSLPLEIAWIGIPSVICAVAFTWASSLYFRNSRPPTASTEIFVIGKQWMWHLQHPEGVREINELHVPVHEPIKLTMISQDVIHDFFIPAFRIKHDVLPGYYASIWFQATKTGKYHFFCAQYCGAQHSEMTGWVYVMTQADYQRWLSGLVQGESMVQAGARLYQQLGCITCHGTGRGPSFVGVYGKPVKLSTGETVTADEPYLRESILVPSAKIVAGYNALMPTFQGQVNEEQVLQLIAYIKSLATPEAAAGRAATPAPVERNTTQK